MIKIKFFIFFLAIFIYPSTGHTGHGKSEAGRTFSLDSGYFPSLESSRAFWNFGIEYEGVASFLFDGVSDQTFIGSNPFTRAVWGFGMYWIWRYPQYTFFVSNHEYGHGMRNASYGSDNTYTWTVSGASGHGSIWSFFLEGFGRWGAGASTAGTSVSTAAIPTNYSAITLAGGVNNSSLFSEALEEEIYYQTGHIQSYLAYIKGKMDAYDYVNTTLNGNGTGDMVNLINYYNSQGYGITYNNMKQGALVSRLLSATHFAYAWAAIRYVIAGDPTVRPLEAGIFRLPDLSHYFMRAGLSYKIKSGLNLKSHFIKIALEYIYKGDKDVELTIGYRKPQKIASRFAYWGGDLFFNSRLALGLQGYADFPIGKSFLASVGASLLQANTFEGERTMGHYLSSNLGFDAWGRISLLY